MFWHMRYCTLYLGAVRLCAVYLCALCGKAVCGKVLCGGCCAKSPVLVWQNSITLCSCSSLSMPYDAACNGSTVQNETGGTCRMGQMFHTDILDKYAACVARPQTLGFAVPRFNAGDDARQSLEFWIRGFEDHGVFDLKCTADHRSSEHRPSARDHEDILHAESARCMILMPLPRHLFVMPGC